MRIAILSDSHDNIWKLDNAMLHLATANVILHCGDIVSPFMIKRLIAGVGDTPVHLIWGNNDGDKRMLMETGSLADNIHFHGDFAQLEFEGYKIALIHYPVIAHALAESDAFDLVCYGHDHMAHHSCVGNTILINPGELMGMNNISTIALIDSNSNEVHFIEIT